MITALDFTEKPTKESARPHLWQPWQFPRRLYAPIACQMDGDIGLLDFDCTPPTKLSKAEALAMCDEIDTYFQPTMLKPLWLAPTEPPRKTKGRPRIQRPEKHKRPTVHLGREKGSLIAPIGDGLTPFARARARLGDRVKETRDFYTLDGNPCKATDILNAAGIKTK